MKKAKCLVTGGAGFIGSNLARALLAQGCSVRILDNFSTGHQANIEEIRGQIELIEGDLCHEPTVQKAVQGIQYVFHLGALPSVIRSIENPQATNATNITGTLDLLVSAKKAGVERFIFTSSSSVYGDTPTLPKHEGMPPSPLSPYALSKLTGEYYCRIFHNLYGMKTFSLRYFNVFGPRQDPNSHYAAVIPIFIKSLMHDQSPAIYGDGTQTRDFTFVENVVQANIACCTAPDKAAGKAYNIACGDRTSVNDLAKRIASLLGKNIVPKYLPARSGEVHDSQADNSLARKELTWRPSVDFNTGLQTTVSWFKDHV